VTSAEKGSALSVSAGESDLTVSDLPPGVGTGTLEEIGKPRLAVNRKLIRPNLTELKDQLASSKSVAPRPRRVPPEQTNAESFYYLKQMNSKTPMVVVLQDGEEIRGIIEWYDKNCLKVNRADRPNLLLLKHNIKYLYKESEETNPSSSDHDGHDGRDGEE
jgi:sRNA-binding regulator protein Hfq